MKKLISLLMAMMLVLPVIANAARAPEDKKEPVPVFARRVSRSPKMRFPFNTRVQ